MKLYRLQLDKRGEIFKNMLSIAHLFNFTFSYIVNQIRINPVMLSSAIYPLKNDVTFKGEIVFFNSHYCLVIQK